MSIGSRMKSKGSTVTKLADESGVDAAHLSAYKNGSRTMGVTAATKLSAVLDETPETLMIANRTEVMKRAVKRGDRSGVLNATKAIVELGEDSGLVDSNTLDELVESAVKFAESRSGAAGGILMDDESDPYGYEAEGRNPNGTRKVNKSFPRTATPEEVAAYRAELEDDEIDDEGREEQVERERQGLQPRVQQRRSSEVVFDSLR